jgi:hypothetical protein
MGIFLYNMCIKYYNNNNNNNNNNLLALVGAHPVLHISRIRVKYTHLLLVLMKKYLFSSFLLKI